MNRLLSLMPTTENIIANLYALEQSAVNLLTTNRDTKLRHESASEYMRAFHVIAWHNPETLPDTLPSYKITLDKLLDLVDNPFQPDSLRADSTILVQATMSLLDTAAEYESLLSRVKSPDGPQLMDPFKEALDIKRTVVKHFDFPDLMNRLAYISETTTQRSDTRQEAIKTFNIVANSAVTTFGHHISRDDFDVRFIKLASTTKDPEITRVALKYGFSGKGPIINLWS